MDLQGRKRIHKKRIRENVRGKIKWTTNPSAKYVLNKNRVKTLFSTLLVVRGIGIVKLIL